MKLLKISLITAFCLVAVCLTVDYYNAGLAETQSDKPSPQAPYDDFMIQRIYPNSTFDTKAYLAGLNEAVKVSQQPNYRLQKSSVTSWTLEGPGNIGGRFNCLEVNPFNSDVMYAGSANGGVWKTTDDANTWTPVFDSVPYIAIGAIAINPSDTNEIWVGTGDLNISGTMYLGNGLYKSSNGGITWSYVGLDNTFVISSIIINPANTNEMVIAAMGNSFSKDNNRGIYKTIDGGLNFTQVKFLNDSTGFIDMIQDPVNPSTIYASSFTRIRTDRLSVFNGTEVNLYKSVNFGQTWVLLSGGLPNGSIHERLGVTMCKSNPSILYALYSSSDGSFPLLYKTFDGGNSWSGIPISLFDMGDYGYFGWYFGKIYCDPVNPDLLYIPGVRLQYSTDGGVNWFNRTNASSVNVHADGHHMFFINSNEYIYCTDGGIYRTYNAGFDWEDIENIPNNQFYAVTEDKNSHGIYAGGVQDNGTMYGNSNGINNFVRIYGGDGFTVAYANDPNLVYSEYQNGGIVYNDLFPFQNWGYLQTDGSQNYNWHTPYFLSHFDEDTLYFAGQSVMLIDGAPYGNYTIISPVLNDPASPQRVSNISTINQSKLDRKLLYAGTADGKVWSTLNGGNSWNDITPFQGSSFYVTRVMPSPNISSYIYVTRSGYRSNDNTPLVFKSSNNGNAWTSISGDLPALAVNDIEILPGNENIIFLANDAGVYVTTNGGTNWERVGDNMPYVAVLDIHLNYNNSRLIAGTFGRSIYTIDILDIINGIDIPVENIIVDVYPNPTSNYLYINASKPVERLTVYSLNGTMLLSSNAGEIDVTKLSSGKYFLKVKVKNNAEVIRRFVKF